jgi:hypothetical protein
MGDRISPVPSSIRGETPPPLLCREEGAAGSNKKYSTLELVNDSVVDWLLVIVILWIVIHLTKYTDADV